MSEITFTRTEDGTYKQDGGVEEPEDDGEKIEEEESEVA